MTNFKLIISFSLILFFSTTIFSHGPSRQKVSESIEINASADDVWKIVSNFSNFKWNENIENVEVSSNEIGSERIIKLKSGGIIKQKLEKLNSEKMMISWRVIETDNKTLPVNSYAAKVFVKNNENKTTVSYKTGFYRGFMGNDPPPELNDENSKKLVKLFVTENLKGLKKLVEGK
tara:strand:- start:1559 stop:2086 length:528 start_codon:yes stop_codon:yes gene_type:complete